MSKTVNICFFLPKHTSLEYHLSQKAAGAADSTNFDPVRVVFQVTITTVASETLEGMFLVNNSPNTLL